jgi:hypothetical protein
MALIVMLVPPAVYVEVWPVVHSCVLMMCCDEASCVLLKKELNISNLKKSIILFSVGRMMLHHNTSLEHNYGQLAKPLHIQQVEQALQLEPLFPVSRGNVVIR